MEYSKAAVQAGNGGVLWRGSGDVPGRDTGGVRGCPPVINTDFAAYPPVDAVPATCTGGTGGPGVLLGYRAFIDPTGVDRRASPPTRRLRRSDCRRPRPSRNDAPVPDLDPAERPCRYSVDGLGRRLQRPDHLVPVEGHQPGVLRPFRRPVARAGAERALHLPVLQRRHRSVPGPGRHSRRRLRAHERGPAAQRRVRLPARRRHRRPARDGRAATAPTTRRPTAAGDRRRARHVQPQQPQHAHRRRQRRHAVRRQPAASPSTSSGSPRVASRRRPTCRPASSSRSPAR